MRCIQSVTGSTLLLLAGLYGCASGMIEVRKDSGNVALAEPSQVIGCLSRGSVTVSVIAELGYYSRSIDSVDADLAQLARNGAVDAGGDTIVKGDRPEVGRRTFAIYKCHS